MIIIRVLALAILSLAVLSSSAFAAQEFEIRIKDHKFNPETITIPAGEKVKLVIHNDDPTPEEFESYELNREKIIKGGKKGVVFIGPLEPGEYPFFGEFNMDTALGKVIVE